MIIMLNKLIQTISETVAIYETKIENLPPEEKAIQRDIVEGLKKDIERRRGQYKQLSSHLNKGRIEGLK